MSNAILPQFSALELDSFIERLDALLQGNLQTISKLLQQAPFTWENLMQPLEDLEDALERFWSPLSHTHAVINSPELRSCYQACLPKLSAYEAAIGQNDALYQAVRSLDPLRLEPVQQKIVRDTLRNFELSGVALSTEKKQRFEAVHTKLADLTNQFDNNVLDASQAFSFVIEDRQQLQGLPPHAIETAKALAQEKNLSGWLLNLEYPCFQAVVTYADDRKLREIFYEAYVTRASEVGPHAGEFDNTSIIQEVLALRHEMAELLGFTNYAELSLAAKMADSTQQVIAFILDLAQRGYGQAQAEMNQLAEFGRAHYGLEIVAPWDIAYLSEKMREQHYAVSQEDLRPYFPLDKVLDGLFTIIHRLYGVTLERVPGVDVWHADVSCYRVVDDSSAVRGFVYLDLFARQNKRSGAWMDSCQSRRRLSNGQIQYPIAMLTCNFAKPGAQNKAYLSHDEVLTLFHECGHCLHHLLTKVDYISASGINGVEWDAVELPSQIFENWCWEQSILQLLTEHKDSGQPLPPEMTEKLLAAKNFQSAMAMMRQLEFSLFDFLLHQQTKSGPDVINTVLQEVRARTTVVPVVPYNRFQNSFSHIFAGGYAAGYYSYKWAEVLSSDAYARFEEEGILNPDTGRDFLHCILEAGSSRTAAEAFKAFRGREASIDALLRHNGILNNEKEASSAF